VQWREGRERVRDIMMEEEAASNNRKYGGQGGKSARGLISKDRKPSHRDG
jgi:hypothetical protein